MFSGNAQKSYIHHRKKQIQVIYQHITEGPLMKASLIENISYKVKV